MAEFRNWIRMARAHWREHLPKKYAALEKAGKLDQALKDAAEQTYLEVDQLEQSGYQPDEAWQMVRETYLLPPPESELQETPGRSLTQEAQEAVNSGLRSLPA